MATTFDINQLAALAARDEAERPLLVQRIRQWTTIGLLPLAGDRPGTGRSRKFGVDAIFLVRILNTLAENGIYAGSKVLPPGFFNEIFRLAKDAVARAGREMDKAFSTMPPADRPIYFLVIYRGQSLRSPAQIKSPGAVVVRSETISMAAGQLNKRAGEWLDFPAGAVSAVVINLSALAEPILMIS